MSNLLQQPYCEFDPVEWKAATGVPSAEEASSEVIPATEADCPFRDKSTCPVHGPVQGRSASECADQLLTHFANSPPEDVDKQRYYSISGIELAGFDLRGQTLYAEQAKEIDLRHLIVHGRFSIARGAIANRLTLGNSLFSGSIIAKQSKIDGHLSLNHSQIKGDVSFDSAELRSGLELRDTHIKGSLILNNVTIGGDLDLSESKITGDLDLSQARIQGDVKMSNACIEGNCNLAEVQIEGAVHAESLQTELIKFNHATISGHILIYDFTVSQFNCKSTHVKGSLNLISADIDENLACSRVNVEGETRIAGLDVGGDIIFDGSQLNHLARIWRSEIGGELNLDALDAKHHIKIAELEVNDDLILAAAELGSFTLLDDVIVRGELLCNTMNSSGSIVFDNITVREDAKLRDISIEEHLKCSESYIKGDCDISVAQTKERVQFVDIRIGGAIVAHGATIGQRLHILESSVSGTIQLIGSQLGTVRIGPNSIIGGFELTGSHITDQPLDITGIRVRGIVSLDEAVIERDAKIDDVTAHSLSMEECLINGSFTAINLRVGQPFGSGSFEADQLTVEGDTDLTGARIGDSLRLSRAKIGGNLTMDTSWIRGDIRLGNSHLCGEVVAANVHWGDLRLAGATLEDDLLFLDATLSGGITAYQLTSHGDTVNIVRSSIPGGVNIENASFSGDFVIARSDIRIQKPPQWESDDSPGSVIQATGTTIKGELLLESDIIHGDVDISEATIDGQLRVADAEDSHSTIIDGNLYLKNSIIEQQLILTSTHLHEGVVATDIRIGSKTIFKTVTGEKLNFGDGFFKWNVKLKDVYVRDADFSGTTLQNEFTTINTVVSQAPLNLQNARIHSAELNQGYTSVEIDCTEATIEELTVNGFDEATIWDDIKIEKTRFDGFDFTGFTESLHKVKYRIHHNRDSRPAHRRFVSFYYKLVDRLCDSFSFGNTPILTRNLNEIHGFRKGHLEREITYRRAKDSADSTSDNTAASGFYRLEKKHRRRRRFWEIIGKGDRKLRNTANYGSNFLLGIVAGHGERISRVGYSAGFFLLFFTVMYVIAGASSPAAEMTSRQSLSPILQPAIDYFFLSIASFVNIPGTIPETAPQPIRFISYIERFIGAAYIPLFVFTLTRSLHR